MCSVELISKRFQSCVEGKESVESRAASLFRCKNELVLAEVHLLALEVVGEVPSDVRLDGVLGCKAEELRRLELACTRVRANVRARMSLSMHVQMKMDMGMKESLARTRPWCSPRRKRQ